MPALEERTEYAYQNIRTKNYQWGNGDKVSSDLRVERLVSKLTLCRLFCKLQFEMASPETIAPATNICRRDR